MRFIDTNVIGARLIEPSPHHDDRGRFMRVWCAQEFSENGLAFVPVQANMGFSRNRGTTRGMHFQDGQAPEAKLVRCTRGSMFDVVLDLRPESPSYGQWYGAELSADNGRMLYVPECCAHGYVLHGFEFLHSYCRARRPVRRSRVRHSVAVNRNRPVRTGPQLAACEAVVRELGSRRQNSDLQ
jgi:dTDP-4-dehydrorhamnose 3,5-epimerase